MKQSGFVSANDLQIYFEIYGEGESLLLLHGGADCSKWWAPHLDHFSKYYQVITIDGRGHGKTLNGKNKFDYKDEAEDVAAFINKIGLNKPFVCGYSHGGQVALELGINHPELSKALVIGGACYQITESYTNWFNTFGIYGPGNVDYEHVEKNNPDFITKFKQLHSFQGESSYWKNLLFGLSKLYFKPLNYKEEDFKKIVVPTLILAGDRDPFVPVEQSVNLFRWIDKAELSISPNTTHSFPPDHFSKIVLDFLMRQTCQN